MIQALRLTLFALIPSALLFLGGPASAAEKTLKNCYKKCDMQLKICARTEKNQNPRTGNPHSCLRLQLKCQKQCRKDYK